MKKTKILKGVLGLLFTLIPGVFFLSVPTLLRNYREVSEFYGRNVFPIISRPFVYLSSLVPVSLSEIIVVFLAASSLFWITWLIYRFSISDHKAKFILRLFLAGGIIFSVLSISFTLMHGINYTRVPLEQSLHLDAAQRTADELEEVSVWLAQKMNQTRPELAEDENGCMILSTTLPQALFDGSMAFDSAADVFPLLSGTRVLAKPVALSHYWSYTGITGMYFPFLGEANVNIDVPHSQIPMIICHEISHTRGIAREQDANLAGFLACISSDRQDFQYCGYQFAFLYCAWDLYSADPEAYSKVISEIPDNIRRDWAQNEAYWKQFEGPVQETSTEINNSYLQANLQEEGVKSYDRVTDLIIEYYFSYVKGH